MTSALAAVREHPIRFDGEDFRAEVVLPRNATGLVYLLRDNGNVIGGRNLSFWLREHGLGVASCDLLTEAERCRAERDGHLPVTAESLSGRLVATVDALRAHPPLEALPTGIAASGPAAAAAFHAAALRPEAFDAIACRHASLLSASAFASIRAATLFLAVAGDLATIRPMTRAFQELRCPRSFHILPGTSPSFSDERTFSLACTLIAAWMRKHIGRKLEGAPASNVRVERRRA